MKERLDQAFEKHVAKVHSSEKFKEVAKQAQPFFNALKDFAFGHELTLENMVSVLICASVPTKCSPQPLCLRRSVQRE